MFLILQTPKIQTFVFSNSAWKFLGKLLKVGLYEADSTQFVLNTFLIFKL